MRLTKADLDTIGRIAARAAALARRAGTHSTVQVRGVETDTVIALTLLQPKHPLRLDALLSAPDFDFAHDVFGILRHIDRATGELGNCFVPRASEPAVTVRP